MKQLVFLLSILVLGSALETQQYEGLRLDMSALTLNRDILGSIMPGLVKTLAHTFADINEAGNFFTHMYLTNIKITGYKINEERFDMNKYTYNGTTYTLQGAFEAIYFHISFNFKETFIGIPINTGHGSGAVTNLNSRILVFFNESDPDVQLPHPWDVKNVTLSSLFPPTSWCQKMLHTHFVPHFHKAVDDSLNEFAHNLLKNYRYIEDIFPHNIDLVFRNDIISVMPSMGGTFISIAFKTNITVDQHVIKKMYRRMNGTIIPRGDFDYCLAGQLVPDVMDALAKGGYYDAEVDPGLLDYKTSKIREFFPIMPNLQERYTGDEDFAIHCQSSRFETVNDITERGKEYPLPQMQNPTFCFIYAVTSGEYFLILDIFLRFFYEMKCTLNQSFIGHVLTSDLYDFKTLPELPYSRHEMLDPHVRFFAHFFSDSELMSPGIKILPNREKELKFDGCYAMSEDICFHYKENRTI